MVTTQSNPPKKKALVMDSSTLSRTLGRQQCVEAVVVVVWAVGLPCKRTRTRLANNPRKVSAIRTMDEGDVEVEAEDEAITTTRAEVVEEEITKVEVAAVEVTTKATKAEAEETTMAEAAIKDAEETASNSPTIEAETEEVTRMVREAARMEAVRTCFELDCTHPAVKPCLIEEV